MVIALEEEHRLFEIIDREKEMVQLGKKSLMAGRLTDDAIERGLSALKAFKAIADSHNVDQIICTATSAVRESSNGKQFVRLVKAQTGIDIRVLSGTEEARMIALAVRTVVDLKDRRALIIDIGGGSMELIVADSRNIYLATSLKAGVIRLTERFMKSDPPSVKDLKRLKKWLSRKLDPLSKRIQDLSPTVAVGTSGTILALGSLVSDYRKANKQKSGKERMNINDLEELNERLQEMTYEERLKMPGLDKKRADQIVAGGMLVETVMDKCRMNEVILCDRALREGLIADFLIRKNPTPQGKIQARELRSKSVLNLINRWEYDRVHAEHASRLGLQLFDALDEFHTYGTKERELLEYALLLHDIGRVISYPGHHKHGWYIVKNSNLIGFRNSEIDMIAAVVGFHRGRKTRKSDPYIKHLKKKERNAVKFMTAILRVVDGLDRQHNQTITKIEAKREGRRHISVSLASEEPALIPLRAAAERSDLLQRVLKLDQLDFQIESATSFSRKSNVQSN
jgi:exopolyphosphatase/guanosine-5'-triphosphate,3'-diphosphate pyrophosphatase